MLDNLKVLGLAMVAVFAMGAVMASSALAVADQGELISDGPLKLTGTDTVGQNSVLTFTPGEVVECHGHYLAGKQNVTPHGLTTLPLTTLTVAPTYTKCRATKGALNQPATVTMNGCDYLLHLDKTIEESPGQYAFTTDIVCPAGKVIEIHAYSSESHTSSVCTYTIGAQTGLKGGIAEDAAAGAVTFGGKITGISATRDQTVLCGSFEEVKTAELAIDAILSGTNEAGAATAIELPEKGACCDQGELISDGPVKLTGTDTIGQNSVLTFTPGEVVECHGHYLTGKENVTPHGFTTLPLTTLTVAPTYTKCRATKGALNQPATVTMNGCDYLLHLDKTIEGSPGQYAFTTDIVCPAGKVIEIHAYSTESHATSVCTYTIGAQTGLKGGLAEDAAAGAVTFGGKITGISATRDQTVLCGAFEEVKTAELEIDAILSGTNKAGTATAIELPEKGSCCAEQGELTSDGSVKLTGTDAVGQNSVLTFTPGEVVECHGHYLTGKENVTPHGFTTLPLTALTFAPTFTGCRSTKGALNQPNTITMNGCDFLLHIGKTTGVAGQYAVTLDFRCPAGKVAEMHAYSSESHASSVCTYTFSEQNGLAGGIAQNVTEGGVKKITLGGVFKGITATRDESVLCGAEETSTTAELALHTILSGTNVGGAPTEVTLSEV